MASTADGQRKLQDEADAAAAAGDYARALSLLEEAAVEQGESPELWMKLTAMRRTTGDVTGALKAVERALALGPLDFSALLSRALLLERLGEPSAGEAFGHAIAQAPSDERIPAAMAKAVGHARRMAAEHQKSVEARLDAAIPAGLTATERARVERFV